MSLQLPLIVFIEADNYIDMQIGAMHTERIEKCSKLRSLNEVWDYLNSCSW